MSRISWLSIVLCTFALILGFFLMSRTEQQHRVPPAETIHEQDPSTVKSASTAQMPLSPQVDQPAPPDVSSEERDRERAKRIAELKDVVSSDVRLALGWTGEERYYPRIAAVRRLSRRLSIPDRDALYLFLDEKFKDQDELDILSFNAIKNDILNALHLQDQAQDEFALLLVDMFRDESHDDVWRDYCIQHLALYYKSRWTERSPGPDNPARNEIKKAYWEAAGMTDKSFAGTALIGLELLSRSYPEFDRNRVAYTALFIAKDESAGEPARITALQTCSQMGNTNVLNTAQILAQTGETTSLRLSAIAALGYVGTENDIELLESLLASGEKRLHHAAMGALDRLRKKLN